MEYLQGELRGLTVLFKTCIDDMVPEDNTVRLIDQFVDSLNLEEMGFRPHYHKEWNKKSKRRLWTYSTKGFIIGYI
jgi:transposase